MKNLKKIFPAILIILSVLYSNSFYAQTKTTKSKVPSLPSPSKFQSDMRSLWEEHTMLTRTVILCMIGAIPGEDEALKKYFQNQTDIGNLIKPYYGKETGDKLIQMLNHQVTITTEVIYATKSGNTRALDAANAKWYTNADDISGFLGRINPDLDSARVKILMGNCLKLTSDEIILSIKKDRDASLHVYEKIQVEIVKISAILSDAIIKQFPEKFKSGVTKKAI